MFTPSVYLADVSAVAQGSPLGVGGQNMYFADDGAYTGELSGKMLREVGADRVLIGHSERRHVFREPDDWMGKKLAAALKHDMLPIFCVGETFDERKGNKTDRVLKKQLEVGLSGLDPAVARRVTIAYEPVWAIGTGEVATPEQAGDAHKTIRKWLHQKISPDSAQAMRILYGGSVKADNIRGLLAVDDVDGALVGGASLKADTFLPIIEFDS